MEKSNFKPDIERLRGFAILLVVVSHSLAASKDTALGEALYTATRGATWPFVFIAGYLFAHLRDRYTIFSYLRSKLRNVIAPYLVVVSCVVLIGLPYIDYSSPLEFWKYYLWGYPAASPMWFIPMIILFYIGFPFYRSLCSYPRTLAVVTALAFGFAILLGRPLYDAGPLTNFGFFQSAFLFGLTWRVYERNFDQFMERYTPLVILLFVIGINVGMSPDAVITRGQIFALIPMTMLLVPALRLDSPLNPMWEWLASRSFGIFFLHGVVTDQIVRHFDGELNAWAALALGIALTFVCGLVVSMVRVAFGSHSRLLVGA